MFSAKSKISAFMRLSLILCSYLNILVFRRAESVAGNAVVFRSVIITDNALFTAIEVKIRFKRLKDDGFIFR